MDQFVVLNKYIVTACFFFIFFWYFHQQVYYDGFRSALSINLNWKEFYCDLYKTYSGNLTKRYVIRIRRTSDDYTVYSVLYATLRMAVYSWIYNIHQ